MHRAFVHLVALSAFAWGGPDAVDAQERSREPHTYFREHAKLTDKEIRDIENGKAFAEIVDTGDNSSPETHSGCLVSGSMGQIRFRLIAMGFSSCSGTSRKILS